MWCAGCQTDVAGEISPDGRSVRCSSCGGEVSSVRSPSLHPRTREIRDLLERWSTEELLNPDITPPSDRPEAELPAAEEQRPGAAADSPEELDDFRSEDEPVRISAKRTSRPKFRLDSQHDPRSGSTAPVPAPHPPKTTGRVHRKGDHRLDSAHSVAPAPHFDVAAAFEGKKLPGSGESLWGQLLAYLGIGLLTVGTGMVVWGYFGGPANYTPTGWLLATGGQMLLFLGVVTLVSGGMEQTTHEVSRRIQILGDHMIRIERHAQEQLLRGPHFAAGDEAETKHRSSSKTSRQGSSDG